MPDETRISERQESSEDMARKLRAQLRTEHKKLALVQEIGRALSSTPDRDNLLALIMEKVTLLMEADRSTLYLLSESGETLWSKVIQGGEVREIRLSVGEGIAGWVAKSGDIVNIPEAYQDDRFNPAVDHQSGYRTRSILCVPMVAPTGSVIGVVQVLNKQGGPFTRDDEELLVALASQAAVAIENANLYLAAIGRNRQLTTAQEKLEQRTAELNVLYEVERTTNVAHDLDELLAGILQRAIELCGADAGAVALIDDDSGDLRFRTTAGKSVAGLRHRTLAVGSGILGWTAKNRMATISNEPTADIRFAADFMAAVDLAPKHIIAAPLALASDTLGIIALVDRKPDPRNAAPGFSHSDLKLLTLIAGQASRAIQIARARQERDNQSRLATIGQMLASMLHDFKTPMTIISGYAQLMAQMDDPRRRNQQVNLILRQFDLMNGMAREVLAFARGDSGILIRKVYLNRFLEAVTKQLEHVLKEHGISLVVEPCYSGVAYFDEQKILRLIYNLAQNAAEAMDFGGELTLRTDADPSYVYFELSDTGPGIPAQLEGRLFDAFSTGKKGGTGLGLAIVKKIVDEHDADISYESKPGEGTTFRVRFARERPPDAPDITGVMSTVPR